jgi:hypothetical protein
MPKERTIAIPFFHFNVFMIMSPFRHDSCGSMDSCVVFPKRLFAVDVFMVQWIRDGMMAGNATFCGGVKRFRQGKAVSSDTGGRRGKHFD